MEQDLPTPVSNPPSHEKRLHSWVVYPPQKYVCEYMKMDVCKDKVILKSVWLTNCQGQTL